GHRGLGEHARLGAGPAGVEQAAAVGEAARHDDRRREAPLPQRGGVHRGLHVEAAEGEDGIGADRRIDQPKVVPDDAQRFEHAGRRPRHDQAPTRSVLRLWMPPIRLAITITTVVRITMVRLRTAMAPTSPLSLRSKIRTDSTLVSEVNKITAAESSRTTPTKMKHQVAIAAERSSGAVMSFNVRR